MRALAVARTIDAGEPRVRPAIALVRDAEKIQVRGLAATGHGRGKSLPTPQAVPAGLDTNRLEEEERWLEEERERFPWPDDPDEVPVWRLRQEHRAREIGIVLPSYRTRRQFEAAIAACEAAIRRAEAGAADVLPFPMLPPGPFAQPCSPSAKQPGRATSRAPLAPDDAALGFYDWLTDHGLIGEWSHEEMSEFYQRHCSDNSLTPTPENVLRAVLKRLPGVNRVQDDHRVKGQGRKRPVVWKIELAPSQKRRVS